ncbi:MAG TPA: hypothetical protein VEC16_01415 [Alphaproteobacteria bacterium]|nr:hypothetical protein [Alphaproteobacteria bacterium]
MGIMDFLKKKEDSLNYGLDSTAPLENSGFGNTQSNPMQNNYGSDFGSSNLSSMNGGTFGQPQQQFQQQDSQLVKDIQMISLKLDSIKSELDAMSQRLKNLESIAEREQQMLQQPKNKKWY